MFDLNEEVEQWRKELETGDSISETEADELENHLRETFCDLRDRLDSQEEAFWLAQRRMGTPSSISEEFSKINSAHVWRRRALWMLAGYLTLSILSRVVGIVDTAATNIAVYNNLPLWISFAVSSLGFTCFLVGIAYWTWNAAGGGTLGLQGVATSFGNRARAGGYFLPACFTLVCVTVLLASTIVFQAVSAQFLSVRAYALATLIARLTFVAKQFLLIGMCTFLVCWLARRRDSNSRKTGSAKASILFLLLGLVLLVGFGLLSLSVEPLMGAEYAAMAN